MKTASATTAQRNVALIPVLLLALLALDILTNPPGGSYVDLVATNGMSFHRLRIER